MTVAAPAPQANMGQPVARIDGRDKVTGLARYPSDVTVDHPAFAVLVTSAIARGEIHAIDRSEAEQVDGLLTIMTYENTAGEVQPIDFFADGGQASQSAIPLNSRAIAHDGQIVAVVVADTFEAAREAASRLMIDYTAAPASAGFDATGVEIAAAKDKSKKHEDPAVGDAQAAFRDAPVKVDVRYSTPTQHHNPIELYTTTCAWNGSELTVWEPSQFVYGLKKGVADQLGIEADKVRVVSPYVGGAFGGKGSVTPRTALVAIAARRVGRPVKLVASRDQGFTIATYRAETRHHLRLGATADGKLSALLHEGWEVTSRADAYKVAGTEATSRMYACPNVWTKVNLVHADRNTPGFMRSPPEVPYVFALESALDELAVELGIDPIELRRINDTMTEPIKGLPYTSRSLMRCYDEAAKSFGWKDRNPKARSMRQGDWLVGWGAATSIYPSHIAPAAVRLRVSPDRRVRVETAAHDIGTGAYTIIAQAVASRLEVPLEQVSVSLGDSSLPPSPVAGGSNTTASVVNAIAKACDELKSKMASATDGREQGGNAFDRSPSGTLEVYAEWLPDGLPREAAKALYEGKSQITGGLRMEDRVQAAFGAELVEVRVHARTGEVRVPRIVGAFAGGHIMNPRTARSQLMGGMIWGIGSALHEATEMDVRAARYINDNLADYLIAVNADVQQLDVILVPEQDDKVNPAGIKGLGELGNVGTAAAVANAVYHATGKRVRDLPIRIDALIS